MHKPKLSIYAATQGMRACNNNNMRNPFQYPLVSGYYYCYMPCVAAYILSFGLCMLLLHALIPCVAAYMYILPLSLFL